MDLRNLKIKHKTLDEGTILGIDESNHVSVEFANKTVKFQYPMTFDQFLTLSDKALPKNVLHTVTR